MYVEGIIGLILPRYCCICQRRLNPGEAHTCIGCLSTLPFTRLKGKRGNVLERILSDDRIIPQRAASLIYYMPAAPSTRIFFHFKYYNHPDVAVSYGRIMAQDLQDTDFFDAIDLIIPVPISRKRLRQRGYNQSERLAHGISKETGIPVEKNCIERSINNPSQVNLSVDERSTNTHNIFTLTHPERITGKHLLIVDDVITTGSTVKACAHTLLEAPNVRISFISLGMSTWHKGNLIREDFRKF